MHKELKTTKGEKTKKVYGLKKGSINRKKLQ